MTPFPESAALTMWLGLAVFLVVEAVFITRHVAGLREPPDTHEN